MEQHSKNIIIEYLLYIIDKHPDKDWDWFAISMTPNITIEFIDKYPNKPWNWEGVSKNPNITMEFIEKHPDKPWHWEGISYNPNITMEFIEKHTDKPLYCTYIPTRLFKNHPDKSFVLEKVFNNPNITTKSLQKHLKNVWDRYYINANPNITFHYLTEHSPKPLVNNIILNKLKESTLEILKKKESLLRFRKIQKN